MFKKGRCPEGSGSRAEAPNEVRGTSEETGFLTLFGTDSAISLIARVRHCEGRSPEAISELEIAALPEGSGPSRAFGDRPPILRESLAMTKREFLDKLSVPQFQKKGWLHPSSVSHTTEDTHCGYASVYCLFLQ